MSASLVTAATDELHDHLSAWAHEAQPPQFIVRRLLPGNNNITVDIVGTQSTSDIDRFVLAYRPHEDGGSPTTITASAGTLTTTKHKTTVQTLNGLQRWMDETKKVCNL